MTAPENPPAASRFTPEQIERNRQFLKDLRANEKKARGIMRSDDGGRCCLCVAADSARAQGANLPKDGWKNAPKGMGNYYGWPESNPVLTHQGKVALATRFNDGDEAEELTHSQIADAFEETFPELKADALLAARKEASHE